jgi:Protein of unknown function (DUF2786)
MVAGSSRSDRVAARLRRQARQSRSPGCHAPEAGALTAKAAELVARYGIDRALLAVQQPDTDHPADRKVDIDHPWARVQALRRARTRAVASSG